MKTPSHKIKQVAVSAIKFIGFDSIKRFYNFRRKYEVILPIFRSIFTIDEIAEFNTIIVSKWTIEGEMNRCAIHSSMV